MKVTISTKEWFVVFDNGVAVTGPIYGNKKSYEELKKRPGAIRKAYATVEEAVKGIKRGPGYDGDSQPPLF